ncbi:MBL fold hydrolase [Chlorobiota bacterium]|nr:MBL fold hydrolase [Chlorobiota bacterium]
MKIEFYGAARTVTGSQHLLTFGEYSILLDCGLFQGKRSEAQEFNRKVHWDAASIDAVILSHAHIDHSGNLPTLVKHGFKGSIYATPATRDLCAVMLMDSAMIQMKDARFLLKHKGEHIQPLYDIDDVADTMNQFDPIQYKKTFSPVPGVFVTFFDVGHLLGSAAIVIEWEENKEKKRLLFTGDIGRENRPILKDPDRIGDVDYIISESTYGGRLHEVEQDLERNLLSIIHDVINKDGKLLIPAFSVGRTQELIWYLNNLYNRGLLPKIDVYVDSPLAIRATDVFRLHPECFDSQTRTMLYADEDLFTFPGISYTREAKESKKINTLKRPAIIIAGSGMCESGRILHHLAHSIEKESTSILFLGYNAPHTLGRKILDGNKEVRIFGNYFTVRAAVHELPGLSGHADHAGLIQYLSDRTISTVKEVFLVHGELQAQELLAQSLKDVGFTSISIPERGTVITI